jgi:hypothetical protein
LKAPPHTQKDRAGIILAGRGLSASFHPGVPNAVTAAFPVVFCPAAFAALLAISSSLSASGGFAALLLVIPY